MIGYCTMSVDETEAAAMRTGRRRRATPTESEPQHVERPHPLRKRRPRRQRLERFTRLVSRDELVRFEHDADRIGGELDAAHPGVDRFVRRHRVDLELDAAAVGI